MKWIKIGTAAINQIPLDWPGNRARIAAAIEDARRAGVSVLCLPELCITGYGCEDAFLSANTERRAWGVLKDLLPATSGMIVCLGLPVLHRDGLFDCACLAIDGHIAGFTAKQFLAGHGINYEPRWFKSWPARIQDAVEIEGQRFPIGDLRYDCGGVRIGFEICEDAWVANRPGRALALKGTDIILNPSASYFSFGEQAVRERFVTESSRAFDATYVYSNLLGNEAGRAIYGGGALVASAGRLVAAGPRFSFHDFNLTSATVDVERPRSDRVRTPSFRPHLGEAEDGVIRVPFEFPSRAAEADVVQRCGWESGADLKQEEFTRAEALGLFDYLRKSKAQGFVVSLSGGADSTATACLVHLMVELGLRELGPEDFKIRLDHIRNLSPVPDAEAATRQLLTTVYQASEHSASATREIARQVAEAIGAEHYEWEIGDMVSRYVKTVEQAVGMQLDWSRHDLPLQNIQARARSPGLWLLANVKNALLLATGNRSETAVGYLTMDGDTSGGLCPLAGIDKAWLRRWLEWLERAGPEGLSAIPALAAVNRQSPSAELRPSSSKQRDEEDLMPYDVLDAIERAAIRDKLGPLEVFERMRPKFARHSAEQLGVWIERFFRLWSRNQWKRERLAPSFHLDDENLDPKTWCRFPILSAGFETELLELRHRVQALRVNKNS